MSESRFQRGDRVKTLFDTGAFGLSVLFGLVVHAGPKTARVVWESSIPNIVRQDNFRISLIQERDESEANKALRRVFTDYQHIKPTSRVAEHE